MIGTQAKGQAQFFAIHAQTIKTIWVLYESTSGYCLQCQIYARYFQQIMEQFTKDLPDVATYMDYILVSRNDVEDHLNNVPHMLQRLEETGLCCQLEKCHFAQSYVDYQGHLLCNKELQRDQR